MDNNNLKRRLEILEGDLLFPEQILELVGYENEELIKDMFLSLWMNYLRDKTVSTVIWFERFNNEKLFNKILYYLSISEWITSTVDSNYAYIELNTSKLLKWVTIEEIKDIKLRYKFHKYRFKYEKSISNNIVQINNRRVKTGLCRNGFKKAGNNTFTYDEYYINKYADEIAYSLYKDIASSTKDITYEEIVINLFAYAAANSDVVYNLNDCIIDSRGRAIYQCLKKVFNPISSKVARSLIRIKPIELTEEGLNKVYAFIAELLGYKGIGEEYSSKIITGKEAYKNKILPDKKLISINTDALHTYIWLSRIYAQLDYNKSQKSKYWDIPIEIDATASMIQIIGILTNDHNYLDKTNVIGETLQDIWTYEGLEREQVKKAMQPILYGSSANPNELWDKNKIPYTQKQLNIINEALNTGIYKNAKEFKDFIISQVKPKETMSIKIWNDLFHIECNKFKWESREQIQYPIYTSAQNIVKRVTKTVNLEYDLEQFKRYFVTLLIHNIDSQIANKLCDEDIWLLPNHDSFIVSPNDVETLSKKYIDILYNIYINRKSILRDFFKSIGIETTYHDVCDTVKQKFEFQTYCLK